MKLFTKSAVVISLSLVAFAVHAAPAPSASASSAVSETNLASGHVDACALAATGAASKDGVGMTAQCNYLAKCCEGNTPNAPKCCEGYFKKCGGP